MFLVTKQVLRSIHVDLVVGCTNTAITPVNPGRRVFVTKAFSWSSNVNESPRSLHIRTCPYCPFSSPLHDSFNHQTSQSWIHQQ